MNKNAVEKIINEFKEYKENLNACKSDLNIKNIALKEHINSTQISTKTAIQDLLELANNWMIINDIGTQLNELHEVMEEIYTQIDIVYKKNINSIRNKKGPKEEQYSQFKKDLVILAEENKENFTEAAIKLRNFLSKIDNDKKEQYPKLFQEQIDSNYTTLKYTWSNTLKIAGSSNKELCGREQYLKLIEAAKEKIIKMLNDLQTMEQTLDATADKIYDKEQLYIIEEMDIAILIIETTLEEIGELKGEKEKIIIQEAININKELNKCLDDNVEIYQNKEYEIRTKFATAEFSSKEKEKEGEKNLEKDISDLLEEKRESEKIIRAKKGAETRKMIEYYEAADDYLKIEDYLQTRIEEVKKYMDTLPDNVKIFKGELDQAEKNLKQNPSIDNTEKEITETWKLLEDAWFGIHKVRENMRGIPSGMKIFWKVINYFLPEERTELTSVIDMLNSSNELTKVLVSPSYRDSDAFKDKMIAAKASNDDAVITELIEKLKIIVSTELAISNVTSVESLEDLAGKLVVPNNELTVTPPNQIHMKTKEFSPELHEVKTDIDDTEAKINDVESIKAKKHGIEAPSNSTAIKDTRANFGGLKDKKK